MDASGEGKPSGLNTFSYDGVDRLTQEANGRYPLMGSPQQFTNAYDNDGNPTTFRRLWRLVDDLEARRAR